MPETGTDAERREANKAMIRDLFTRYHEIVTRDLDELRPYYTDDTVLDLPQLGTHLEGIDATLKMAAMIGRTFSAWRQVNFRFHDAVDPDEMIWEADADGTYADDGTTYEQTYVLFLKLRDGRIAHHTEYVDTRRLAKFPPSSR
ncbi:MAG: nuclear transport factor 2 family protein [Acidimicrobiia bacterium]